jgi:hypothetical protein
LAPINFRLTEGLNKQWDNMEAFAKKLIRAKYGIGKAIGLATGNCNFTPVDSNHLKKLEGKIMAMDDSLKDSVTCVEVVILCYQMTFRETDNQFIRQAPKRTLPSELSSYLTKSAHWGIVT